MKMRTLFSSILLLSFAAPLFGQLPSDADVTAKLIGSWDMKEEGLKGTDTFSKDGTFKGEASAVVQGTAVSITVEGKWSVKDGVMTETIAKTNHPEFVPVGSITHDKLTEVTDKTFKARTADGTEEVHVRHPAN